jgi:hypothetical protein
MMRQWGVIAGLILIAGSAIAGDGWTRLTGAEVTAALTARSVAYEGGASQDFRADGGTTYTKDSPTLGHWRVQGAEYCSVWPPSDRWACYSVERSADGLDIRFVAQDGSATTGRYNDLQ